ncbi:MAG TPA: SEC-C metal-binding domain-containing protein, partial [Polyangiaceae bacterium]|nr:SEC-C metal-binding domain-containing protein [Polyangiaceae bacterium]
MPAPTRLLVQKLAAEVRDGKVDAAAEVERAWSADDAESVATYALAAAAAGKPLPAASVLDAVVLLDDLLLGALLAANVTGDRVKALLDAVERDDTTDERDALALYLAATLRQKKPPPPSLLALVRTHARRGVSRAAGELLVAATAALADETARAVVAESFPAITQRQALDAVATLRAAMDDPILESLPDYAPASLAAPIPVRRTGAKAGRNDPCPCGSGKKYKKCCQDKEAAAAVDPEVAWRQQLDAAVPTLSAQQVADLRLADLAALPYEALLPASRLAAYRQLLSHRRWDAAERVLDAMAARGEDAEGHRVELVDQAFRSRSLEIARKHAEKLREGGVVDSLVDAMLTVATTNRALSRLDALAGQGLREDPVVLLDVADALLAYHPALGIVAARGALATAGAEDAVVFLELVEEARDRLGLPAGDPAGDVYDALVKLDREREATPETKESAEELASEARALRAHAREASARVQELEARLRDRQREPGAAAAPAPAAWESERSELRERVNELKSLIA